MGKAILRKVTGKDTPYLVQEDLLAIFSRNPDNYSKCRNCLRITYFEYGKCVSCNHPIERDAEISPDHVLCQVCGVHWKTKISQMCMKCKSKLLRKRGRVIG